MQSLVQRLNYAHASLFLGVVVLLPVIIFPLPPLLDYPNHIARLWLISGGINTLSGFYIEDWHGIGTNIGIDIVAKVLGPYISPFLLARILLALAVILPPAGAMALNTSVFRNVNPWQLVFPYFWCCETLLAGFLNFQIGLGIALSAATADRHFGADSRWLQHGSRFAISTLLLVLHPFALLFYCALLVALAFGSTFPEWTASETRLRLFRVIPPLVVCVAPLVVFFSFYSLPGERHTPTLLNGPLGAMGALLSPFYSYNGIVDLLFAYSLLMIVAFAAARRIIQLHAGLIMIAAALAIAALFMPQGNVESSWLDRRLPIMGVLAALAGTSVSLGESRRELLAICALALVVLRTTWIAWNWAAGVEMVESIKSATASVPPGAVVLSMRHSPSPTDYVFPPLGRLLGRDAPTYNHLPTLLIPWRQAFVPTLFAEPGKQPIKVRDPWKKIAEPKGGALVSINDLTHPILLPPFMRLWRTWFDYILVLDADRPDRFGPFVPPSGLHLVKDAGFAQLFRIEHDSRFRRRVVE